MLQTIKRWDDGFLIMQSSNPQAFDIWLHFHVLPSATYLVTRSAAQGSGAMGSPVPFARNWNEAAQKLSQAGLTNETIVSIGKELNAHGAAQCGPIRMTSQQGAVLGLHISG